MLQRAQPAAAGQTLRLRGSRTLIVAHMVNVETPYRAGDQARGAFCAIPVPKSAKTAAGKRLAPVGREINDAVVNLPESHRLRPRPGWGPGAPRLRAAPRRDRRGLAAA